MEQLAEVRTILLQLSQDVAGVKAQLTMLPDFNTKLDAIGDTAKAAKASTDSAHKRLDEIAKSMNDAAKEATEALGIARELRTEQREHENKLEAVDKLAAATAIQAANNDKRLDKYDAKFWAVALAVIGLILKMVFDMFKTGSGS